MLQPYSPEIEQQMKVVYEQLSEKDRRLYAAIEAQKLPRGSQTYLANVFGCARKTIRRGITELLHLETLPQGRIRHAGGGRKRMLDTHPELDALFLKVLDEHTAGDPMNADIRWTNLTPPQIVEKLELEGVTSSPYIVKQLLDGHDYVQRKAQKQLSTGQCEDAMLSLIRSVCSERCIRRWAIPLSVLMGRRKNA